MRSYLSIMESSNKNTQVDRRQIAEMLFSIKDDALLLQIKQLMMDAGVNPVDEIRTMADLEARLTQAQAEFAEGNYQTTEELLAEMETWK